jgi:hypothetical protein
VDDLEDRVDAKVAVGVNGLAAVVGVAGERVHVDAATAVQLRIIDINGFIVGDGRAYGGAVGARRREGPVVRDVVIDAGRAGGRAGDEGGRAGERVGGLGPGDAAVGDAVGREARELRRGVLFDVAGEVLHVHAVDADEEDVFDLSFGHGGAAGAGGGGEARAGRSGERV